MRKSESGDTTQYRLKFIPAALDEWNKLDGSVKEPLRKALRKRLVQPHLPGSELHGDLGHCYKIKLKKQGYRLVYSVGLYIFSLSIPSWDQDQTVQTTSDQTVPLTPRRAATSL